MVSRKGTTSVVPKMAGKLRVLTPEGFALTGQTIYETRSKKKP
jgi:hypothetical protein